MIRITATLVGTRPLIMHNGRLNDPLDEIARELSALVKQKKSLELEAYEQRMGDLEWQGGLYHQDGRVGIPSDTLAMVLTEGARKRKNGKTIQASVLESDPFYPLEYDGPKNIEKLMDDPRFRFRCRVKVQRNGVMRTRPIFREWKLPVSFDAIDDVVDALDVKRALEDAGLMVGMGDWRPRYGRFTVENFKVDGKVLKKTAKKAA